MHSRSDPQRERVVARGDADEVRAGLLERLAHRLVIGVLKPRDLPAARLQRLADLAREVATTHQEQPSPLGHGADPTSQQDFEPQAVQASVTSV
jgi:hypothetical protein